RRLWEQRARLAGCRWECLGVDRHLLFGQWWRLLQHSHRRWTPPVGTVRFRAQPHQWRLFGGSATDPSGSEAGARRLRSANLIAQILPFSLQKRKTPRRITSTRRFWLTT